MIRTLRISNLALIEDISVVFQEGLNVFTGETGAGKTIILQGLELLLGARGDTEKIRSGKERLEVEGFFTVPPMGRMRGMLEEMDLLDQDSEETLLIRRVIGADGKSRCWVNGRMCNVSTLSELGEFLVDLHGQHEHQRLLKAANHLEYLDALGDAAHQETLRSYDQAYRAWRSALRELEESRLSEAERARKTEELLEKIKEIESVAPRQGELEDLEDGLIAARNREALFQLVGEARARLESESAFGAVDLLASAQSLLERAAEMDSRLKGNASWLYEAWSLASDTVRELNRYLESMVHDPDAVEAMESRVFALRELFRKYGGFEETMEALREARANLEKLEGYAGRLEQLQDEVRERQRELEEIAERLTGSRKKLAERLKDEVNAELEELGMSGATFHVRIERNENFTESGRERVEMLISPAPGEDALPINKAASGGELARLMLALKVVLARADQVPILVFDEVDAGIGGVTAMKVGEKMAELARHHQVICVTHLPQIAVYADAQFRIFRTEDTGRIQTMLEELDEEERVAELARMLGGKSESAILHARELLRQRQRKAVSRRKRGR